MHSSVMYVNQTCRGVNQELIAELTSPFLCGEAGISPGTLDRNTDHDSGWLGRLRDEQKLIVVAAAHAQKAADLVLGKMTEERK